MTTTTEKKRILLVEDEPSLQDLLKMNLELDGYKVTTSGNGSEAIHKFNDELYDLVVLDIMIPGIDGLAVCENIRLKNQHTPILFLSAKNTTEDKIAGLKKGADDYLTKPFNLEELQLRIRNLVGRKSQSFVSHNKDNVEITFGKNKVNFETYNAWGVNGKFLLTKKEAMLIKLLYDHKNEVVSRESILQTVWGYHVFPNTRTIDNFIMACRKHFEEDPKNPKHFHAIRGVGYKFEL